MSWTEAEWAIVREMQTDIKSIQDSLRGNGQVGMCERVRAVERLTHWLCRLGVPVGLAVAGLLLWHVANGELRNLPALLQALAGML